MNFLLLSWFCMSLKQWQQACIRAEHLNSIPSAIRAISSRKVSLAVTRPAHFTLLEALRGKHPPLCITLSASPMLLPTAARETSVRNCLARCSNKGQPQKDVPRANCSATALDCRSASSVGTALMCAWDLIYFSPSLDVFTRCCQETIYSDYFKGIVNICCCTYETGGLSAQHRSQIVAGIGCIAVLCFHSVCHCWPCL